MAESKSDLVSKPSSATSRVKILVVEDHPAVREALAARIAQFPDLEICGEAADVAEALKRRVAPLPKGRWPNDDLDDDRQTNLL